MESPETLRQLTDNEIMILIKLAGMDNNQRAELHDHVKTENDGGWVLQAVEKHCKARGLDVEKAVQIMICVHGEVIGKCVKLIDFITDWSQSNNKSNITFDDYSMKIFAHGIPVI